VEDDAERMPVPGANAADAVPQVHAIEAFRALDRAMANREDNAVALFQRDNFGARLHARTLLSQDEFAAAEIAPWI
jgi:hypothetical protein